MKIVYFHGYGSSSKSDKVSALNAIAPDIPILYDDAKRSLYHFLLPIVLNNSKIMFVGTSLGGYWASKMSDIFGVPSIVINPSTSPKSTLGNYNNPLLTNEELQKYPDLDTTFGTPKIVLLAKDDEILNYTLAEKLFNGKANVKVFENGGHRFNEINTISNNIDELLNHSFYLP